MTVMAEKAPGATSPAEPRRAWRRAGLLFALATALLFALHLETVAAMVKTRARLKAFLSALEANQGLAVTLAQTDKTKTADEARNKETHKGSQ